MRASRLLAILIILQLRGKVRAIDLAREFEVSIRTIYRDIDELSAAGIPVYGDGGPGGGISLLEGFKTQLNGLENNEAASIFLFGLPQQAQMLGLGSAAKTLTNKVLLSLPKDKREKADAISQKFHFDFAPWYFNQKQPQFLQDLTRALINEKAIAFQYESWSQAKSWEVSPLGMVFKGNEYYLVAFNGLKKLVFKIDRISNFEIVNKEAKLPKGFVLEDFWNAHLENFYERIFERNAILMIDADDLKKLGESIFLKITKTEIVKDSVFAKPIMAHITYDQDLNLVRYILGANFRIKLIFPENLIATLRNYAMEISKFHS